MDCFFGVFIHIVYIFTICLTIIVLYPILALCIMKFNEIQFEAPERFKAVIEIEKGSNLKYEYDPNQEIFILDFTFTPDLLFPYAYGFIPGTLGGDGDPLDVFVLSSPHPLKQDNVVDVRPIGMIDLIDQGQEDYKIIAVPVGDEAYQDVNDISQLGDQWAIDMKNFYMKIADQKKKEVVIRGFRDANTAIAEIQRAYEAFI